MFNTEFIMNAEQLAAWKRGELVIEFQFDGPPMVNPQDFERWIQERQIKPKLINYSEHNASVDIPCPTWEVPSLESFPSIEEINEPR